MRASGDIERPRYLGETIKPTTDSSHGWHAHDFGQIISAASGSMYVGTPGRVLLLSPAMVLWIPPEVEHWMRYGSRDEMRYVDVNKDESRELGPECRIMSVTPLLMALMSSTMPEHQMGRQVEHNAAVHDLLRHELINAPDVPLSIVMPQDKRLTVITEAAFNDPGDVRSVRSWLAGVSASRKTIERVFVEKTGMPPSRWLRQVRVLHAISKLAAGEKVSLVAQDMGYASSSAFSYMFRQTIGSSPSDFHIPAI